MDQYNNLAFQKNKCYNLISKLPQDSKAFVIKALKAAEVWHKGQMRINPRRTPYIIHIYRIVIILFKEFKIKDPEILAAGALRDVIEDCEVTEREMMRLFGKNVTTMVKSESQNLFPNRKSYMEHLKGSQINVKKIKLADRMDNLMTITYKIRWPDEKVVQYMIESERYILPIAKGVSPAAHKKMTKQIQKLKNKARFRGLYKEFVENEKFAYEDTEEHKRK